MLRFQIFEKLKKMPEGFDILQTSRRSNTASSNPDENVIINFSCSDPL